MTAEIRRQAPRSVEKPEAGYFLMRLVKGGVLVPVAIIYEFGVWRAEIDGVTHEANADPLLAPQVMRVWLHHREAISRDEYRRRRKIAPAFDPTKPVKLDELPPMF